MRSGEQNGVFGDYGSNSSPPRFDRYFHLMDGAWYVESPSGEYGPFRYRRDAEQFARALLDEPSAKHCWNEASSGT